jgi:superfamily II RNA helicase
MRKQYIHSRLPPRDWLNNDLVLDCFMDYAASKNLDLYPAQEEAILALFENKNVILNTPTGSGKSLVATALHLKSLAWGRRSIYTCPIKALVNEKFLALCRDFGPDNVGMVTGDASVNADAPILCCTAEILSNMALRDGNRAGIDDIIMDEFHYYSDRERGVAWQIPLLTLTDSRFLLMSATLGETTFFEEKLSALTGLETLVVKSSHRPVPLDFNFQEIPLRETVLELIEKGRFPLYLVHFTQLECTEEAQNFLSVDICSKDEKKAIAAALEGFRFDSPYGKNIQNFLRHGIGLHHAGLLPKYRILVEQLAQQGLLKVICGTDTLGVGVNIPIRTVVFTKLCKFDGEKLTILSVRDFQQISGRAGRKGFDDLGSVVAQAPEHIVENLRMEQKAVGDAKKMKKMVKRKPPERGFLPWTKDTFVRLTTSQPEQLTSRFQVTHGMLLNVLSRERGSVEAMRALIRDCHETAVTKKKLRKTSFQLFRSLVERKIIEIIPNEERVPGKSPLRVNVDLQEDFSLNQASSLYLIDTIKLLDPLTPDYALDVLTLVESILENPDIILRKQLAQLKNQRMAEMKMDGLEYEERMAELEKLEYPKPNRDFIYDTFNAFTAKHPWVGQENIRPKSVAREMYETFQTFDEYIRSYDIQPAEGALLRYLSYVYKALAQTVPDLSKTDELKAIEVYFGTIIRDVDSSLLDEWEMMRNPKAAAAMKEMASAPTLLQPPHDITRDRKTFTVFVRNEVFRFMRALALQEFASALTFVTPLPGEEKHAYSAKDLEELMATYVADHSRINIDTQARHPSHTSIRVHDQGVAWTVEQVLTDPEDHNDWVMEFFVDLDLSREKAKPVISIVRVGPIGT